jgi:predicted MPP superfamily phosphohydrolase
LSYLSLQLLALPFVVFANYRIRRLLPTRLSRNLLTASLALVVIGYPIADLLSRRLVRQWAKILLTLGFCCLPFILYLVPTVILFDLIFGLLRWRKLIPAEAMNNPTLRVARFWVTLIIPAAIVSAGAMNNSRLVVRTYSVEVPRKSSQLTHLRIVFASDFHLGYLTEGDLLSRFASEVNAQQPDIVLFGGDIQDSARREEKLDRFEDEFRQIRAKYGVYAVTGNHDILAGVRADFFARAGIRLLRDSVEKIDDGFYLAGRDDPLSGTRKSIADLLRNIPDDLPIIVLDHRPIDLDSISRTYVDLQLSGHTHDLQFFPINLFPSHEFELNWGYIKKRRAQFIVTSGVHLTRPPVRTAGLSEIIVINVEFRSSTAAASSDLSTTDGLGRPVH